MSGSAQVDRGAVALQMEHRVPDILGELSRRLPISRASIAKVLQASGRLEDVRVNPAAFIDGARASIEEELRQLLADGIEYVPKGLEWEARTLLERDTHAYLSNVVKVSKSITDYIECDSDVEKRFAADLEARTDVPLFLKLPSWFKVDTPIGGYNPDWAIVQERSDGTYLYLVRETKGASKLEDLRFDHEVLKIKFGDKHFASIGVDYHFGKTAVELLYDAKGHLPARHDDPETE